MFLENPIFRREFMTMARSWKTAFLISAYLSSLALLLVLLWPSGGVHSVVTDNSREIFSMFSAKLQSLKKFVNTVSCAESTVKSHLRTAVSSW